jgi:hypothetical protein
MTNTTQNVGSQHQHNFNAQGVCGCGLTYDKWQAAHDAELAGQQPKTEDANAQEPEPKE